MTLTLKLTPEKEQRLLDEAARHGLSVAQYIKDLLDEHLPDVRAQERSQTFQEWAENHNRDNPLLAEEAMKQKRG